MTIKRIAALIAALTLMLTALPAMAADEVQSRSVEQTYAYEDETLSIAIEQRCWTYRKMDLRFFVAHITCTRPEQLRTAFAGEQYSMKSAEATSEIAKRHDAILAINGDYYNYKDKVGLVIRNGELYRDDRTSRDQLLVMDDGSFEPLMAGTYDAGNAQALMDRGAEQGFTFGPMLVMDGQALEMPEDYLISTDPDQREPRTAIGWVDGTHYVVVVADGRRNGWSEKGMTLPELAGLMAEEGCKVAYNMDGGGSSTLYFNGERINKASGSRERDVSDIVYFTK